METVESLKVEIRQLKEEKETGAKPSPGLSLVHSNTSDEESDSAVDPPKTYASASASRKNNAKQGWQTVTGKGSQGVKRGNELDTKTVTNPPLSK